MAVGQYKETLTTPPCRLFFPRFFSPNDYSEKYDVKIGYPKGAEHLWADVYAAMDRVGQNNGGQFKTAWSDGDKQEQYEDQKGLHLIRVSSTRRPVVMAPNMEVITNQELVYSGVWARFLVNIFYSNTKGTWVSLGLDSVQLLPLNHVISTYAPYNVRYNITDAPVGGSLTSSVDKANQYFNTVAGDASDPFNNQNVQGNARRSDSNGFFNGPSQGQMPQQQMPQQQMPQQQMPQQQMPQQQMPQQQMPQQQMPQQQMPQQQYAPQGYQQPPQPGQQAGGIFGTEGGQFSETDIPY